MNAENPVQTGLFGLSATRTKDTRLAEHIGGSGAPARKVFVTFRGKVDRRRAAAAGQIPVSDIRMDRPGLLGSQGSRWIVRSAAGSAMGSVEPQAVAHPRGRHVVIGVAV